MVSKPTIAGNVGKELEKKKHRFSYQNMEDNWWGRYNITYANSNSYFIQIKQPSFSRSIFSHHPQR